MAKRSSDDKKKKSGGWWSLVVLAAAGLTALGVFKRREFKEAAQRALPSKASPQAAGRARRRPGNRQRSGRAGERTPPKVREEEKSRPLLKLPAGIDSAWVPAPAGSLRVVQRHVDSSAAILFVHGLGGTLEQWAPALQALPASWRGIAFDLPGHGSSDAIADARIDDFADALGAVIDGLGLRRAVLVGHSFGAAVALRYAGRQRHRVAGLLLVDPNGDQTHLPEDDRRELLSAVRKEAHDELREHYQQVLGDPTDEVRRGVIDALESTSAEVLYDGLASGFEYSPLADLDRYAGPVRLVLSPLNDLPFSLQKLRPQLRSAVVRHVGHWLMLERPAEFADLLDQFLDTVGDRVEQVH